jgi:uncharacterized protein YdhG (YjbR/CyaY superfamily)
MAKTRAVPTTVDEYLARLDPDKRAALRKLRRDIRAAAPGAEECISYRMPAFRISGRILLWMGAAADHVAFYPGGIVRDFAADLGAYDLGKGTIRFSPARPLPAALVRTLVKARLAQLPRARREASAPAVKSARGFRKRA